MSAPVHMRKLFIGGLDYVTTDDCLKEYFSHFGNVVDAIVMKMPKDNRWVDVKHYHIFMILY